MPADPFVVFDIETSGPVPSPYSMLSLGAVLLDGDTLETKGEWTANFGPLYGPEHVFDPATRAWWDGFPEQLAEALWEPRDPHEATDDFVRWVREHASERGRAVLLAAPAGFDGMFVNHYAVTCGHRFEELPWKHRIMDLASFMVGKLGIEYHHHGRHLPRVEGHDHRALGDARVLAERFRRLRNQETPLPLAGERGEGRP